MIIFLTNVPTSSENMNTPGQMNLLQVKLVYSGPIATIPNTIKCKNFYEIQKSLKQIKLFPEMFMNQMGTISNEDWVFRATCEVRVCKWKLNIFKFEPNENNFSRNSPIPSQLNQFKLKWILLSQRNPLQVILTYSELIVTISSEWRKV